MSECSILELDNPSSDASQRIGEEIERAKAEDRAEAIVLGCAGMADLAARLSAEHDLPVVDGVAAAVKLAETLASLRLTTSKRGAYPPLNVALRPHHLVQQGCRDFEHKRYRISDGIR
jgi:allantoin racemase